MAKENLHGDSSLAEGQIITTEGAVKDAASHKEQENHRKMDAMLTFIRRHKSGVSLTDFSRRFSRGTLAKERQDFINEMMGRGYIVKARLFEKDVLMAVPGVMQEGA